MNICECNCKGETNGSNRFIIGHNRRGQPSNRKGAVVSSITKQRMSLAKCGIAYEKSPVKKLNFCQCNCGQMCRQKFAPGHGWKRQAL